MGRYTEGSVARDILAGAVAGVAAIWVADKLDQAIYQAGGRDSIRKTEAARPGGMDPAHVLAKRAADAVGADIGNPKDNAAGHMVHYGIAAGMGALYGLLRGMAPGVSTGRGALFGMAMFVLQDEVGNTVMGTAGNPLNYPVRDHARGAAAHTLFGIVTDLGTRLISPWRDKVVIEEGPPLSERLDQGRGYLDQGARYVGQLAGQARARLPEVDAGEVTRQGRRYAETAADTVRSRMPDYDDAADLARAGANRARRFAANVRSQLPGPDSAIVKAGRQQANHFVNDARVYVSNDLSSGFSRAMKRLFG